MHIYITSRTRTPSSDSPSDFQFAPERPIELPEGARGAIDSITCSNVWEAVLANVNDALYCQWSGDAQRIATLEARYRMPLRLQRKSYWRSQFSTGRKLSP